MPTTKDQLKSERDAMTRLAASNPADTPATLARRIWDGAFPVNTNDYTDVVLVKGRGYYSIYSFLRRLKAKRERETAKAEALVGALTSA